MAEGGDFVARLRAQRRIGAILEQIDLRGENPELVDELVGLSKKYGVMTPYTSFLALEGEALTDGAALQDRASRNLRRNLGEVSGASANYQRQMQTDLSVAASLPAAAPVADARQELKVMPTSTPTPPRRPRS